jgi:hypothetical protein
MTRRWFHRSPSAAYPGRRRPLTACATFSALALAARGEATTISAPAQTTAAVSPTIATLPVTALPDPAMPLAHAAFDGLARNDVATSITEMRDGAVIVNRASRNHDRRQPHHTGLPDGCCKREQAGHGLRRRTARPAGPPRRQHHDAMGVDGLRTERAIEQRHHSQTPRSHLGQAPRSPAVVRWGCRLPRIPPVAPVLAAREPSGCVAVLERQLCALGVSTDQYGWGHRARGLERSVASGCWNSDALSSLQQSPETHPPRVEQSATSSSLQSPTISL